MYQIVHIDRDTDAFAAVIGFCALEQFTMDGKLSDEFELQVPIQVHERRHGAHNARPAGVASVWHRTLHMTLLPRKR